MTAMIGVEAVKEHEDGSGTYQFHMDEHARSLLTEEGLKLVLYCAAAKLDIQVVYDFITDHIEYNKDIRPMDEEEKGRAMEREQANSDWEYTRKDTRGNPVLHKRTDETENDVKEFLDARNIKYRHTEGADFFEIYPEEASPRNRKGEPYMYTWEHGRWGIRIPSYHSNGIQHFIDTYFQT